MSAIKKEVNPSATKITSLDQLTDGGKNGRRSEEESEGSEDELSKEEEDKTYEEKDEPNTRKKGKKARMEYEQKLQS